jgi:hypothetical protein
VVAGSNPTTPTINFPFDAGNEKELTLWSQLLAIQDTD